MADWKAGPLTSTPFTDVLLGVFWTWSFSSPLVGSGKFEIPCDRMHFLPKPFAFAELIARIRALARRSQPALAPVMRSGDLTLDTGRRIASRAGRRLDLSAKELAVLELLLAARSTVVSPEELLARAWDEAVDPFSAVVKVTISRLRRKLGDPPIIETVPGAGYRI
jgi:DNA-binding response OmpR family regulator